MKSLLILILVNLSLYSQGFDWQGDIRLPHYLPNKYIALDAGFGLGSFTEGINLNENNVYCCNLLNGVNQTFTVGTRIELWHESYIVNNAEAAFVLGLAYQSRNDEFKRLQVVPKSPTQNLETEFIGKINSNLMNLKLGYKQSVNFENLNIEVGLNNLLKISNSIDLRERVIAPSNFDFGAGVVERVINGLIPEQSKVVIMPYFAINYDFELSFGMYWSTYLELSTSINSFYSGTNSNLVQYSIGLRLFKDL